MSKFGKILVDSSFERFFILKCSLILQIILINNIQIGHSEHALDVYEDWQVSEILAKGVSNIFKESNMFPIIVEINIKFLIRTGMLHFDYMFLYSFIKISYTTVSEKFNIKKKIQLCNIILKICNLCIITQRGINYFF